MCAVSRNSLIFFYIGNLPAAINQDGLIDPGAGAAETASRRATYRDGRI